MNIEIIKPFGPSITKVVIPDEIVTSMNNYVEETISDEKKSKDLDYGYNLAGNVHQEFRLDLEFMKKLQGDMATFTKKATTGNSIFVHDISVEDALGKTTDSLEKTAEISIGSAANSNSPVVIAGPSVSTGGGQSPGAGGGNTTNVVNNSSKKTETRVSLADRVRPEQQFMHKFGAM